MEVKNIQSLNSAIFVMRHFVELSAKLLPIYEELTRPGVVLVESKYTKQRIDMIYDSYSISPETSEFLLGSDIISLINKCYNEMKNRNGQNESAVQSRLQNVLREYAKLRKDWLQTMMN